MRIGYYIRNYFLTDNSGRPAISGRIKVVSQHVNILRELGYVVVVVLNCLKNLIENRFGQKCFLIQKGVDNQIFYPNKERMWGDRGNIKIL